MNARFWTHKNGGPVKITLRPGQSLTAISGGPTDEGYHHESESWRHTGDGVDCSLSTDASDCDGRLSHFASYQCPLRSLRSGGFDGDFGPSGGWIEDRSIRYPAWVRESASQCDYSAEAAGY